LANGRASSIRRRPSTSHSASLARAGRSCLRPAAGVPRCTLVPAAGWPYVGIIPPMPTVLVVDDEPSIRALASRMLREAGYEVIEAWSGAEAWTYFQRRPHGVDLLLTDVVMPGVPGTELAARARGVRPSLPVLLMSGYTPADLLARGLEASHGRIVTKPFHQITLLHQVQHAIAGR
jgi:CheY-like chemotaxis protein